jgi:hypothetical protein
LTAPVLSASAAIHGERRDKETTMNLSRPALLVALLSAPFAGTADEPATAKIEARLLALHRDEAKRWEIFVDGARTKLAEFVAEPVYRWTNAARANGQSGAMFVWTYGRHPVALGGVFSNPEGGRRVIIHEFHAIGPLRLYPRMKDSAHEWLPKAAVPLLPLHDAAPPEPAAARRARQMRDLAREFTAHTVDDLGVRWQLRLLPRPLYRYEAPDSDLVEGAVFAFISDAGTDPEIILVLESVKDGETAAWRYRAVRLSISSLYVQYKGKQIWTSLRDDPTSPFGNPDGTYALIRDRLIDELPETSGRR